MRVLRHLAHSFIRVWFVVVCIDGRDESGRGQLHCGREQVAESQSFSCSMIRGGDSKAHPVVARSFCVFAGEAEELSDAPRSRREEHAPAAGSQTSFLCLASSRDSLLACSRLGIRAGAHDFSGRAGARTQSANCGQEARWRCVQTNLSDDALVVVWMRCGPVLRGALISYARVAVLVVCRCWR